MSVVNEEKTDEKAELNARLYEKMQEELDEFRWLLRLGVVGTILPSLKRELEHRALTH